MNNRYLQAINKQKQKTQEYNPLIAGTLGITLAGQTLVEVPDRNSYVYVQVRSSSAEVIEAFNQTVSPVYGLPVFIQWQGNRYVIVERDTMRYSNWGDFSSYLPRHASTHEFNGSAGDVVFVAQQQFMPLLPMPSGSTGNTHIVVNDYNLLTTGGGFIYSPLQATKDLTVWNPTSPTGAQMVLVSLDASNGALRYDVGSGSVFGNWLTGSADVLPHVPNVPDMNRYLPIAAVRLIQGSSILTWSNIYDVRPLFGVQRGAVGGGGGGLSSTSGLAVLNNGLLVDYASQLNLLGSQFTILSSGNEVELTILGGGGGGGTGFLALNGQNGPMFGPYSIYNSKPNTWQNQNFDYSNIYSFLSGTSVNNFAAAIELVGWSTGSVSYGLYVDDEQLGGGAVDVLSAGRMDTIVFNLDAFIDGGRLTPQNNPTFVINQHGGGGAAGITHFGPALKIDQIDTHIVAPALEIQANHSAYASLQPLHTGTMLSTVYPFPQENAPYYFDTWYLLPTGTTHTNWNQNGVLEGWMTPQADLAIHQLRIREYAGPFGVDPVSGSMAQGVVNLKNGTATIPSTITSMSSRIYLTTQFGSGSHVGYVYVYSRMAGSGFTIRSSDLQDTSLVAWLMTEPS